MNEDLKKALEALPEEQREGLEKTINSYVDQERTRASKTASENTKKALSQDTDFISGIKESLKGDITSEVDASYQERLQALENESKTLKINNNRATARAKLLEVGIDKDAIDGFIAPLVSEDSEQTIKNVESFTKNFQSVLEKKLKTKTAKDMDNFQTPGGNGSTDEKAALISGLKTRLVRALTYHDQAELGYVVRDCKASGIDFQSLKRSIQK